MWPTSYPKVSPLIPRLSPTQVTVKTYSPCPATVRGVDLFPPPVTWVPPNCTLEVDNILEQWTWNVPLDLIHMRGMTGSFEPQEWDRVYQQCYE